MSKKLAAKASLIQIPPVLPAAGTVRDGEARVKTAPGSMAHFMASQSVAVKEADELRERLKVFEGARPVRSLDARSVQPSRWANRHEHSYGDAAFAELKAEIASAGTNVQPVSVRALPAEAAVLNGSTPSRAVYELVFGHRRHRACLELGLPLQAMVVDVSDQELFEAMERENRSRKNLCAWEQGTMYRRALDEGLYPSQRRLAEALGVDVALVSKSLALARLPDAVVEAFASPLDIQFRWAQPLSEALQKDPEGVLARARQLREQGRPAAPAQVLAVLVGQAPAGVLNRSTPPGERTIRGRAGRSATWIRDARGRSTLRFEPGSLDVEGEAELVAFVERLLNRRD